MLFSRFPISTLALFLSLATFLGPLSPAAPNDPPAQAPRTPPALTSQEQSQLHDLAAVVLQRADRAGCKKTSCTLKAGGLPNCIGASLNGSRHRRQHGKLMIIPTLFLLPRSCERLRVCIDAARQK
jgi:hypothetical protein